MTDSSSHIRRRDVLKLMATAAAVPALSCSPPETQAPAAAVPRTPSDPDLVNPGADWERVLTDDEMRTVAALCDVIIPADDRSPGASSVGVPDFINEWVSAPYEAQRRDQIVIRGGLVWLNTESNERFGQPFAALSTTQQREICDDIKYVPDAAPAFTQAARFFRMFRNLTATGFYTTTEGMADLQYIGNVALPRFDGPPPEALRHLGLTG